MSLPVRVLLVHDDDCLRDSLRALLTEGAGFDLVADTGNRADALVLADLHQPDVILFDLGLASAPALRTLGELRDAAPAARVCGYAARLEPLHARRPWLQGTPCVCACDGELPRALAHAAGGQLRACA